MYWKYEVACKEAGMSEEEVKKIRMIFDNDRKRMKREKQFLWDNDLIPISLDMDIEEIDAKYPIEDPNCNVEEDAIWNVCMEKLLECLEQLPPDEKANVLALYDPKTSYVQYAQSLGIPKTTLIEKTEKVVEKLRVMMGVKVRKNVKK